MIILTIRTDKPEAEVGVYDGEQRLAYGSWQAHRELGRTLHAKLAEVLREAGKDWPDVQGVVGYKGPGSFTGLRIGLTVANGLAYSQGCAVVGETGDGWREAGIKRLLAGESERIALPEYGAEANITKPRQI